MNITLNDAPCLLNALSMRNTKTKHGEEIHISLTYSMEESPS